MIPTNGLRCVLSAWLTFKKGASSFGTAACGNKVWAWIQKILLRGDMWGSIAVWNYCPSVREQYECLELANWSIRANRGMGLNVESLIIDSPFSFPPKKVHSFLFTPIFFKSLPEIQWELQCLIQGMVRSRLECVTQRQIIGSDGIYSWSQCREQCTELRFRHK